MPTERPHGDDGLCAMVTPGHSTRPIEAFVELLRAHRVTQLIDVRTLPRPRHNPQFNTGVLPGSLAAVNIGHVHAPGPGGFRRTTPDSPNAGWRNLSSRPEGPFCLDKPFESEPGWVVASVNLDLAALLGRAVSNAGQDINTDIYLSINPSKYCFL